MRRFFGFIGRFAMTLIVVVAAILVGWQLWAYYMKDPWTRDGHVRADIVSVAPDVSGLVTEVLVRDNQPVKAGDVLFRIDRQRFELALKQAQADIASKQATLDQDQRDLNRVNQLSEGVVSRETKEKAASQVETDQAALQQTFVARDVAKLNLDRSEVKAPVDGIVTNFELRPGNYVSTGTGVTALVDTDSFRVEGYFEETKLPRIHVGDAVSVHLMGTRAKLSGHVESIATGIAEQDRTRSTDLLANVSPTFSWVRLAQRVPVRVKLDKVPEGLNLVSGQTASVFVLKDGKEPSLIGLRSGA
ncbi:RND family efflux transporter, MFP subunit [Faunimonas pinastri]|uniref:RND family efflux transporter, MFP subunit n=1 Tax=Faunimonas pinastri TaxID=1855383 RepID=A0A1H9FZM5_9HYPH|nr:HlyD family secretion protein [Faunimonas pinastri]SEQ43317.1 RND family efflux transporter, MFP subunit [Faunimonas pinastri]